MTKKSEPNLQNVPIRTEVGRKVREGFLKDSKIVQADFSELEQRVLAMKMSTVTENLENGVPCNNSACNMRISCERFYDPDRKENQAAGENHPALASYDPDLMDCFVLRRRLAGTPEVHREWTRTTKNHRRKGGVWI